jgi:signal transduction histidine kinase
MQRHRHTPPPSPGTGVATAGLPGRLRAITGPAGLGEALASWLAPLTDSGLIISGDGSGWQWDRRSGDALPASGLQPDPTTDHCLGQTGDMIWWFRGALPPTVDTDDVADLLALTGRTFPPLVAGRDLALALSQAAVRSLRREDLIPALTTALVTHGGYGAAAICADAGDDGYWVGGLARRGHPAAAWLPEITAPPPAPPYDDWLRHLPAIQQAYGGHPPQVIPLQRQGLRQGLLILAGDGKGDDAGLAAAIEQIEMAIDTASVYESMRQSAMGFKHLYEVARAFSTTLDYHQAVQLIVQRMAASLALSSCSLLSLNRQGRARLEATTGTGLAIGHYLDVAGVPAFQEAIATLEPVAIAADSSVALGMHGGLVLPLTMRQELIGLICLGEPLANPGRPLTSRERQLAQTIANQAAIAMDNAILYQDMEERVIDRTLELRLANSDLQARQRELELLTQQLQAIIHSIPDGIIVLDPARNVRQCNPAQAQIMALRDHVLPMRLTGLTDAMDLPEASHHAIAACLDDLTREQRHPGVHEYTLPTQTGLATYKILTAPVINPHGFVEGQVIVFHDVTRERELDQMKGDFVATVSHELRTPLSAMIGFVTLLEDGVAGPVSPEQSEYFAKVLAQGERLIRLIDDLLDFSKLEAGQMPLYRQLLDIGETIADVQAQIRPLVEAKQQMLVATVAADLPPVEVDPDKLRQVLINLLSNAIKFSPDRSHTDDAVQGRIEIRAWRHTTDEIAIAVIDNGIGIAPEDLDRIFGKFSQVDQSATRKYGGTGLGLPIVRHLVELHGGRIWVDSTLGQGSVFTFTIPILPNSG